jgi:hypothetical protein
MDQYHIKLTHPTYGIVVGISISLRIVLFTFPVFIELCNRGLGLNTQAA